MILIASDHAGFALKEHVKKRVECMDLTPVFHDNDDYPDAAAEVCNRLKRLDKGILICSSGIGMSIAANKHRGIRAALCRSKDEAQVAREHNDANVLCLGARYTDKRQAMSIIKTFLSTEFSSDERHRRRVRKLQ